MKQAMGMDIEEEDFMAGGTLNEAQKKQKAKVEFKVNEALKKGENGRF
jgi:hypothetical protein